MTATAALPKFVSPSRIARFYFHECERYLRYSSTPRADRAAEGIPPTPYDTSPVTHAILDGGYAWEEQVLATHLSGRAIIAPEGEAGQPLRDRVLTADQSRALLSALEPGKFVYQATLITPLRFYECYGIDPAVVSLTECRPDLIECYEDEGRDLRLRVVDVKASPGVKLSHRIQATMYTLILDHALREWGVDDRTVSAEGGVWLANSDDYTTFDVRSMRPPLEAFLRDELQILMAAPADQARWHLYFRCEWCEYFEHCRGQMHATDDVSRTPYLTIHGKRYLGELDPPVRTVIDFAALLQDPARVPLLEDAASLRGRAERLREQTSALQGGEIRTYGGSSLAMPVAEHVRVVLTLQTEPVSGQIYAYGIYAQGLNDVLGVRTKTLVGLAEDGAAGTIESLEREFVRELSSLLRPVHDYNQDRAEDWRAQKTLQVFTFDTYERELLTGLLVRRILDHEVAEQALELFFYFQQPELVQAEDHPATEVFFPVVVLLGVVRDLLALPLEVSYRFGDVVKLLPSATRPFEYRENDFFTFQLSNQMRSDAIFGVWYRGRSEWLDRIRTQLRIRVWAANSIVNGLRDFLRDHGSGLFAWPPKFQLPSGLGLRHPLLSRLSFIARFESVTQYLTIREARMAPLAERLRDGTCLSVTYWGGNRFELDRIHQDLDIEATGFYNWILTENSDAGTRACLSYNDYANRARVWVPRNSPLALAAIAHVETSVEQPNQAVHLDLSRSAAMNAPAAGRLYLLDQRYGDFNLDRVLAELGELDAEARPAFVELLEDPRGYRRALQVPPEVAAAALNLAEHVGMTESQLAAFDGILRNNLQLAWGPPGTGKTHFLGLAVLCLAEAHRRVGQSFRVLVTAFTHAAIDNCLRKLAQLDRSMSIVEGALAIGKLGGTTLPEMESVEDVTPASGWAWTDGRAQCVLGGTVWGIRKAGVPPGAADLVVIDEASQVKVPESSIAIRRARRDRRLLLAGDHRQLPPVVQAAFPDPEEGEAILHRSVFEALQQRDTEHEFTATLLENFRMNHTLCRYPAEQIYLPDYDSANEDIGARLIRLSGRPNDDQLVEQILDPAYPLVVGVLSGVRAAAENRLEAELVAQTAAALRGRLVGATGRRYPESAEGDRAFWRHGLFIVSPHRAQIHAIQRALKARRAWLSVPFVDTVDKMQGQECDSVMVSYGVSDVEYAMTEQEFIYGLNRLNVSITRARAKTIVFLPRPLIEPPIAAYEDDRIAEGVAFMQGLVQFARSAGGVSVHPVATAELELSRVPLLPVASTPT
jgi:DNA replication ATP-dependent helicase/nuclease Dna2